MARQAFRGDTTGDFDTEVVLFNNWQQYLGDETRPGVTLLVVPEYSGFGSPPRAYSAYVRRNGVRVEPVLSGLDGDTHGAIFVLRPDAFRPSPRPLAPVIEVVISDASHGTRDTLPDIIALPTEAVARVWNDFESYYTVVGRQPFVRAEADVPPETGLGVEFSDAVADVTFATLRVLEEAGYTMSRGTASSTGAVWFVAGQGEHIRVTLISRRRGRATVYVFSDRPKTAQRILDAVKRHLSHP